ncbi:hypothetical protein LOM8899_00203 [Flavimaricola marinus]|uniref:Uncharacterized protein n=1 Tax=Flavimaricola marinus TaxID=1819565 RepID=A0A238L922_9RHOB|nr:hypothetical protein LOM8899_00203 [Flavimaricola marinus]
MRRLPMSGQRPDRAVHSEHRSLMEHRVFVGCKAGPKAGQMSQIARSDPDAPRFSLTSNWRDAVPLVRSFDPCAHRLDPTPNEVPT